MRERDSLQKAAAEIRAELDRIVGSAEFRSSRRGREFLRHIVERALAGQVESLKERTIAVELFGRSPGADLDKDSSVRVCARLVRQRLAAFYASPASSGCRWRIELPVGGYVPVFTPVSPAAPAPAPQAETRWRRWASPAIFSGVAVAGALVLWLLALRPHDALERFWAPVRAGGEVRILLASHSAPGVPVPLPEAVSQAACVAELAHFLGRRGVSVSVSGPDAVPTGRNGPRAVIVLGPPPAGNPAAPLESAPMKMLRDGAAGLRMTLPAAEKQASKSEPGAGNQAVIYRIPPTPNQPFVLILAGQSPRATQSAVSLVLHPSSLSKLTALLPREWERRRVAAALGLREEGTAGFEVLSARLW
jgi:hypothetical protein